MTSAAAFKKQLAKRFDRAAVGYDRYAQFQLEVMHRLLAMLPNQNFDRIVDLGSGTGAALPLLVTQHSFSHCLALDLSSSMLLQARQRVQQDCPDLAHKIHYLCADAESLPFAKASLSLVFSNLAVQWCLQPNALFQALYKASQQHGYFVFTTLLSDSMPEIDLAWQGVDETNHVHQYVPRQVLQDYLEQEGWHLESLCHDTVRMWFDSPEQAVASLRKVGASMVGAEQSVMSPSTWKRFLQAYEKQRQPEGIPLSYQVAFVVAQKRAN
ncbi:malonyl-ACP O-methyltransferase BioC [Marinomonas sp. THO17]